MSDTGANAPQPWYEASPERLAWELHQFAARGLSAARRSGLKDGRLGTNLVVETEVTFKGEAIPIEVAYPFEYPDWPPTVYGPPGLLERHQQPRDGNFCWAEDPDREWHPGFDAAQLVAEDLVRLLADTEAGADVVRAGEVDMPEPVTGLILLDRDSVVVIPEPYFELDLPASEGTMTLVGSDGRFFLSHAASLGSPDAELARRYRKDRPELAGHWIELTPTPEPRVFDDDAALLGIIDAASDRVLKRLRQRLKRKKVLARAECWLGMTFLEEGPERGQQRRNWVFAPVSLTRASGKRTVGRRVRAQALTLAERQRRTPELVGLAEARLLLVGAGSVGSPVAAELVKAGVGRIDIIDSDRYDVNNSVRHTLPPSCAGFNKARLTAFYAGELNPFVDVQGHDFTVGLGAVERARLEELVASADVVVDTTGSNAVARILQRRSADASTPLVVAGLSAGSYGAEVAVFRPGGACFECFLLAQRDDAVPEPEAAAPGPFVTPVGCSHPAFAGAGFDATQLAASVARIAVQVTAASSYPALDFDWVVMNFRNPPRWRSGRLSKHPECGRCS